MEAGQAEDPLPVRLAFRFGYIGSRFAGSQLQAFERTVEGEFIAACLRARLFDDRRSGFFRTSGRTDRGVHSRSSVAAFTTLYPERAVEALNWQLPPDIWCTGYARVDPGFHPRHEALWRTYRYFLPGTFPFPDRMAEAASRFVGVHDFSAFCRPSGRDPIRCIRDIRVFLEEHFTCIEVTGDSFLWHMVRCMTTALILAGNGEWSGEDVTRRLSQAPAERVPPAPAEGLVLWETTYGISFEDMPVDARSLTFLHNTRESHILLGHITALLTPPSEPKKPLPSGPEGVRETGSSETRERPAGLHGKKRG